MKRVLFAGFLLVAFFTQRAAAQTVPHVTAVEFTAEVNLLDAYIGAGNMTAANTAWDSVHHMMLHVLGYTKKSIHDAATPADRTTYTDILSNQRSLYQVIWPLKTNFTANRTLLHNKLGEFDLTIY